MTSRRTHAAALAAAPLLAAALLLLLLAPPAPAAEWVVVPGVIELDHAEARQHLLVQRREDGVYTGEAVEVEWRSENPEIVEVVDGVALPRGDGSATLVARHPDGSEVSATVAVAGQGEPFAWSFQRHVLPVLTRQGCNMGACHGAVAGKGGFVLSLRGYDPPADFYTIAREARGRRIEMAAPARSLLLTKPTMATPHKGGKRLDPRSRDYRVLAEWVAAGAGAPDEGEARVVSVEVQPDLSVLARGDRQRLIVTARYADGSSMDVTDWTQFESADETVALVDDDGHVEIVGYGEGAVVAIYSSNVALARFRSPFPNELDDRLFTEAPRANFIDELVLEQLRQLRLEPSPRCDDGEFIRRASLDAIGTLPTADEVRAFLADEAPDKRERLIDALLQRDEFVDYWAYRWSDVFLVNGKLLRPDAVAAYYRWVRSAVEENLPWDELARQVVTARGDAFEDGATNFYAVHQDPANMAENVSQAFLGLALNCAQCHDHPLEKWTNDQYYAFANLFSRVRAKGWGGDPRNGDGARTLYVEPRGDLIQPRTGVPQPPAPLDGEALDLDDPGDRREALAEWLTSPDNRTFARSIANRVWAAYFGPGLVEPVDDLRASNPASNEPLLDALADHLVAGGYDLKALMRTILVSETYQRGSQPLSANLEDTRYLSRHYPRRLMAEILHDAIASVTGVPTSFTEIELRDGSSQKTELYPEGTRAIALQDSAVRSYFLRTFGRNEREIVCECERSNQPSMVQALHLANGEILNDKLAAEGSIVERLLADPAMDDEALLEEAYLATLSRPPAEAEREGHLALLAAAGSEERREAVEDLFWAIMTSREFLFQR